MKYYLLKISDEIDGIYCEAFWVANEEEFKAWKSVLDDYKGSLQIFLTGDETIYLLGSKELFEHIEIQEIAEDWYNVIINLFSGEFGNTSISYIPYLNGL